MKISAHTELRFAQIVSFLFNPVVALVLTAGLIVINADITNFVAAVVFLLLGGGLPIVADVYEFFKYKTSGLEPNYHHRNEIYLIALFSFTLTTLIFGSQLMTSTFWMNLGMVMSIFFALFYVANQYFLKISLHIGMFCLCIMILSQYLNLAYALLFAFYPILVWSRIKLHKHTWSQILAGTAIGLASGLLVWII